MNARIDEFLRELENVPWFANLGKPISQDCGLKQIRSWEEWPGPEECEELHYRQQKLYDEIMENAEENRQALQSLWKRIHDVIFRTALMAVPYVPESNAWHAPSTAVWHAAWTAGLMGLFLSLNRPAPSDLREQWQWFQNGHWPCSLHGPEDSLVIF